jgi:hypothetical protein
MTGPKFEPKRCRLRDRRGIAVAAHGVIRATGDVDVVPEPFAPGVRAHVCSLADLRSMKRASRCPKDLIAIAELDELHGAE